MSILRLRAILQTPARLHALQSRAPLLLLIHREVHRGRRWRHLLQLPLWPQAWSPFSHATEVNHSCIHQNDFSWKTTWHIPFEACHNPCSLFRQQIPLGTPSKTLDMWSKIAPELITCQALGHVREHGWYTCQALLHVHEHGFHVREHE